MASRGRALGVAALAAAFLALGTPTAAADHRDDPEVGYDVSYPQCGDDLPDDPAFAVVGVNGGLATRPNPCLPGQLEWAAEAATGQVPAQPEVQLYVNTANPGQVRHLVTTWPSRGLTPYGRCEGDNSRACSWRYGWERADVTVRYFFVPAAELAGVETDPGAYTWWLDVETMNTWQTGSSAARARNRAALEGMAARLSGTGAEVGVYSTGYQWRRIAGEVPEDSPLYDLDSWLAGSTTRTEARATCRRDPLVDGGRVVLTQYVTDGLDHDHSCV
ncbi:hypothetical protein E4P41_05040 [Geodermatophilus sp. DF01-2]|uniref:hypothetical protein n=1 Tax=Geodermatophilus sp. DF01-2 TaxID=2559610 RepID=UPI001073743F|nr:hypothetical protein [Geodermatophilus sp. DF01_2]TFV63408.1 hypothetical protein E4P41_05040 [Geodermatophilus sp. DF01_2]